ncbi:GNAT family N-acetyltransferase [Virgibacillus sp. NKC19-3]|uniref:GNAT family N-acetyltransferase n=1 Tax=Virgibacillus saliphilus TaxID=2831674 RepID=UPI001C9AD70F|nr:GNAT family N-acetyltransferase [Virgibacillus sp. NKC19-3]MBY7141877.1 GNAT family N-acetyltransferase [Virgibacillus sp. NKC19-3]
MMINHQLVIDNFEEKLTAFTHAVSGELTKEEDFVIANTEIPTDTFNVLLPKSPNIINAVKIRHGIDRFFDKAYPFSIWIDAQYVNDDWKELIQAYDLKETERNVMMKLDNTLHVGPRISHQLTITKVSNNEERLNYIAVFMSLFEGTSEKDALESYFNTFSQRKLGSAVEMFVGCIDERPVTTGLLIESEDSYGIYDVMTKDAYRGKGIGSEMFQFLLTQTKDKQKPVVLQASDDGKSIYKRFGFTDVGEMMVFE